MVTANGRLRNPQQLLNGLYVLYLLHFLWLLQLVLLARSGVQFKIITKKTREGHAFLRKLTKCRDCLEHHWQPGCSVSSNLSTGSSMGPVRGREDLWGNIKASDFRAQWEYQSYPWTKQLKVCYVQTFANLTGKKHVSWPWLVLFWFDTSVCSSRLAWDSWFSGLSLVKSAHLPPLAVTPCSNLLAPPVSPSRQL